MVVRTFAVRKAYGLRVLRMEPFTLVSTVFNEHARLEQTLADLAVQTLPPSEMLVVDAGSTDGTYEMLLDFAAKAPFAVRILRADRVNIAQGRNLAIREARYDLIASTDFGCRFAPRWLESILEPFAEDPTLEVVGGAFTILQGEVQGDAARADYILAGGYPPDTSGLFSVSSRSIAYRRSVWEKIGGYQEWLTLAADDTIFWRQIKHGAFRYRLVNEAHVFWMRHKTYTGFGKENFRYGLGDGESGINRRNFFSHVAETGARYVSLILVLVALGLWVSGDNTQPLFAILLFFGLAGGMFGSRSYRHARRNFQALRAKGYTGSDYLHALWLIEVTRWYYMRGYVKGWLLAPERVRVGRAKFRALPA